VALGRDAQRLLFHALQAILQDTRLAGVDQRRQATLEGSIEAGAAHVGSELEMAGKFHEPRQGRQAPDWHDTHERLPANDAPGLATRFRQV
jgi:hypothetical protein